MGSPDYLQNLVAYTTWADGLTIDAAARLTDEQLRSEPGGSRGSLLDNLRHLFGAQLHWHEAWTGSDGGARPEPPEQAVAEWLRGRMAHSHEQLGAFAASLTDADVYRTVELRGGGLRRTAWPLWQLMVHIVLHSTQHRAEAAAALTLLGSSPGDLDYGHFCDMRRSQSVGTLDMMRDLYGYNRRANAAIVTSMSGMSDEELFRQRNLSHGSLGIDLLHAMLAQRGWLSIWQEGAPEITLPAASTGRHVDNLAGGFDAADRAIDEFCASLGPDQLGQNRTDNADGHNPSVARARQMPLWDMMMHVLNHSMQHRSEAAMALTALGRSPGDLDLLDYLDLPA